MALILILILSWASLCLPDWLCSAGDHWVINTAVESSHSSLSPPLCSCLLSMVSREENIRCTNREKERHRVEEGGEKVEWEKESVEEKKSIH